MAPVSDDEPNYFWHAFTNQYNLIGLATALGFAILSGSALPLILAAGVELIFLPSLAGNPRFQNVVKGQVLLERQAQQQQRKQLEASEMLRSLPDAERRRYQELLRLSGEIRENYRGLDETARTLIDDLVGKLDFLMAFYLRMRYSVARYEAYFASTDPEQIEERIAMLEHEMAEGPERIQQIKSKTKAVLEKRLERYKKALENKQLVEAQTETVQEVLRFLRDQSFSIKDPRSIAEQLDGLISNAEVTERGVKDLEALFEVDSEPLGFGPTLDPLETPTFTGGTTTTGRTTATTVTPIAPPPPPPPPTKKRVTQ
jgi:hypothetical protein